MILGVISNLGQRTLDIHACLINLYLELRGTLFFGVILSTRFRDGLIVVTVNFYMKSYYAMVTTIKCGDMNDGSISLIPWINAYNTATKRLVWCQRQWITDSLSLSVSRDLLWMLSRPSSPDDRQQCLNNLKSEKQTDRETQRQIRRPTDRKSSSGMYWKTKNPAPLPRRFFARNITIQTTHCYISITLTTKNYPNTL